eukprot:UN15111
MFGYLILIVSLAALCIIRDNSLLMSIFTLIIGFGTGITQGLFYITGFLF